jgi:hypothetical protein
MCWIIKPLEVKSFFDFLLLFDQAKSKNLKPFERMFSYGYIQ